ncbi:MAG TPA: redoxin domain-containing protein [Planctomycetota bacterium]|nr:redoxin domain-containing protein [Planctomycetota bacterium]
MNRKRISLVVLGLLAVGAVVAYEVGFVLPKPDPNAKTTVGDRAPDFALASTIDSSVSLADLTRGNKSAVLVFYRGDW